MSEPPTTGAGPFAALRRFARPRPAVERCELCGAALPPEHPHLLERANRQIRCGCDACSILFCGQEGSRFVPIPRHVQKLSDFRLTDARWQTLLIPINVAFFLKDGAAGATTALYPSPAGVAESVLPPDAWAAVLADNPVLGEFAPDVEALLVNRVGAARDAYRAPIDQCYKLVGILRTHWRGLSGGAEVWTEIGRFFERLNELAGASGGADHA